MSLQDTDSGQPLAPRRKTKQIRMGKVVIGGGPDTRAIDGHHRHP